MINRYIIRRWLPCFFIYLFVDFFQEKFLNRCASSEIYEIESIKLLLLIHLRINCTVYHVHSKYVHDIFQDIIFSDYHIPRCRRAVRRRIRAMRDLWILHGALAGAALRIVRFVFHVSSTSCHPHRHLRFHHNHNISWVQYRGYKNFENIVCAIISSPPPPLPSPLPFPSISLDRSVTNRFPYFFYPFIFVPFSYIRT